jgi:hypothetical protein
MLNSLFGSLFGCSHKRTTFPLTPGRLAAGHARNETYVACLDCGKEFSYDWKNMQLGEQMPASPRATPQAAPKTAPQTIVMRRPA